MTTDKLTLMDTEVQELPLEERMALYEKATALAKKLAVSRAGCPWPYFELFDFVVRFGVESAAEEYEQRPEEIESWMALSGPFFDQATDRILLSEYTYENAKAEADLFRRFWRAARLIEAGEPYARAFRDAGVSESEFSSQRTLYLWYKSQGAWGR